MAARLIALLCLACSVTSNSASKGETITPADKQLHQLIETFWKWRLFEWPEYGTKYGMNEQDELVEEITEQSFDLKKDNATTFLHEAKTIEESSLTTTNRINLKIVKDLLNAYISGYAFRNYGEFTPIDQPTTRWSKLIRWMPRKTAANYRTIVRRYTAIARQIDQRIDRLKLQIRHGITDHAFALIETTEMFDFEMGLLRSNVTDSSFYLPFVDMPPAMAGQIRYELRRTGAMALQDVLLPAFEKIYNFIKTEYRPSTRRHVGVWSLPNGTAYYRECLRWHLSVDTSPVEIHQLGLKEVERIENATRKLISAARPDGNITAFTLLLQANTDNYYKSETELLNSVKVTIMRTHAKLSKILRTVLDEPVKVELSNHGPSGFYSEPTVDGSRSGLYILNSANLDTKPKYVFDALTLHEVEPGHHTQAMAAMHYDLPYFRQLIAYSNYAYAPFNWRYYTSCSEGWALYAESLGEEIDAYTSPFSLFGRYSYEVFRAVRLVVDTGLHAFKWPRQRAVDYMLVHTSLSRDVIEREVNRYIASPGQACAYKIGELKIWELRRRAEKILGDAFDLRDFHYVLLNLGFAPLSLMEEEIDNYIRALKATSGKQKLSYAALLVIIASFLALA